MIVLYDSYRPFLGNTNYAELSRKARQKIFQKVIEFYRESGAMKEELEPLTPFFVAYIFCTLKRRLTPFFGRLQTLVQNLTI